MLGLSRCGALLLFLFLASSAPPLAAQALRVGEVIALRGTVTVVRATGSVQPVIGGAVFREDRLVTGPEGRIKVRFLDGTVVAIGSATELVAAEYSLDASGRRSSGFLSVISGLFRATVAPAGPGSRFEVETATAIASVRSTDWMAESSPENTGVFVFDGAVAVTSREPAPRESVLLQPGEGTDVPAAAVPIGVRRWGPARIEALRARTEVP